MSPDILLDTSLIVAHMRGKTDVRDHVAEDSLLFASLFSLGELEKGINRAVNPERERGKVDLFMESIAVLMPDSGTAMVYGKLSALLEQSGKRIPENDIWIAAVALECRMKLATCDAHFERIPELDVIQCGW